MPKTKACAICGSEDNVTSLVVRCGHKEHACKACLVGEGLAGFGEEGFAEELTQRFVGEDCCRCQG